MKNTSTVLIVEDDEDIRELMKILLEGDGYQVNVAVDGLDAFEQLQTGARPTLILLDLMMPRMDGEQFLKQIHSSRFSNTPVIIMSGHNATQKKADEHDVACWLMKPVELDDLLKAVRRFAPSDQWNSLLH
jgi:CheY-like chemotaxis protein